MNIQGGFPLELTGLISLLSKRLSRVFSSIDSSKASSAFSLLYGPTITSVHAAAAAAAKSLQSCPTLCNPIDSSSPGFPIPGILQARTLERLAILLQCMKVKSESEVTQSCLTLSDPMNCSMPGLPGSSVHGIFQARVVEWGAISHKGC